MPIKNEKDLSQNGRSLWLKAGQAIELHNYGYAISLIQAVVNETPEFLEGRRMLRKAEIINTKGKKSFFGGMSTLSMKGGSLIKKDPLKAIEAAEKELENDPFNAQANHLLKDAAKAAEMPETAAFAMETLMEGNPKDTKLMHELGEYYYETGEGEKAVAVYTRITDINPTDLVARKRGKDAAAKASMKSGGWEEAKDYRDLIKNKDEAISLEQQGRVVKSEEMIDQQLAELGERYQEQPENVDLVQKIAVLYAQKEDLDNAITWYSYANDLVKGSDPAIRRKVSDLTMKKVETKITEYEQWIADNPDHEELAQVQEDLESLKKQRAEMEIDFVRQRVERNPSDLQFRFDLGEQLMLLEKYTEAIPELQRAMKNPSVRIKAMGLLGQCYEGKNMLDLAKKTLEGAASEIAAMDATKKEIVYRLGLICEKMGDKEKSLDWMKQIYETDYSYADVAQRVESSYESE